MNVRISVEDHAHVKCDFHVIRAYGNHVEITRKNFRKSLTRELTLNEILKMSATLLSEKGWEQNFEQNISNIKMSEIKI